jgi:hypothetical protein
MFLENIDTDPGQFVDTKTHGRGNMAETVFSILKQLFGEIISCRSYRQQVKEIKWKCIRFSIDRFLKNHACSVCCEDFNRAGISENTADVPFFPDDNKTA